MSLSEEFAGLDAPEAQPAATMSGTVSILQQFANGLKSRSEETRAKAAKDLQHYVTMELREVSDTNGIVYPLSVSVGNGLGALAVEVFGIFRNYGIWKRGDVAQQGDYLCPPYT